MKRELANVTQMKRVLEAEKAASPGKRRIYETDGSTSKSAQALQSDIEQRLTLIQTADGRSKLDWNDLPSIRARVAMYFQACAEAHTFPTVAGLANHGLGISKRRLNGYLARNTSPTAEYLELVKDNIADVIVNSALGNHCNSVMAIFELKNSAGYRDTVELQAGPAPSTATEFAPEELQKQLESLPYD